MQGGGRTRLHGHKYGQLCQSLLELQEAAERIFNVITSRVGLEHHRMKVLKSRIQSVQAKIDAIAGTNRATTVFSSSKYPVIPPEAEDFVPLFGGKMTGDGTDFPLATISLSSGLCENGGEDTLELFRFFSETSNESWPSQHRPTGIGGLPTNMKSIVDVLLFNSTELPFLNYRVVDNLLGADQPQLQEPSTKPITLPAPPQSMLERSSMISSGSEDFGFRPILGQVPSFSLPQILPDLPMVAEIDWSGLRFGADELPSIAPSAMHSSSKKDSFASFVSDSSVAHDRAVKLSQDSISVPSVPVDVTSIPRNSVAHMREDSVITPTQDLKHDSLVLKKAEMGLRTTTPPPPPPPPPPTLKKSSYGDTTDFSKEPIYPNVKDKIGEISEGERLVESSTPSFTGLPPVDFQRAALLASIRDRVIILRKTGLTDSREDSSKRLVTTAQHIKESQSQADSLRQRQPLNILAEMASSLRMRRLSMQGAAHDKELMGGKVNDRMGTIEDSGIASPSSSSGKFSLPIANLHAYIAKKNEEPSDDDEEWD